MRPGFMIYHADMKALLSMTDKDLGVLMKLLYRVSIGEEVEPPQRLRVVFDMMAERIRQDAAHYADKVEKRRKAGQASAEARQQMSTNVNKRQHMSTDVNQYNNNNNTIQFNNKYNNTLNYDQRSDDMKDVLIDL